MSFEEKSCLQEFISAINLLQQENLNNDHLLEHFITAIAELHNKGIFLRDKNSSSPRILKYSKPLDDTNGLRNLSFLLEPFCKTEDNPCERYYKHYIQQRGKVFTLTNLNNFKQWIRREKQIRISAGKHNLFKESGRFITKKARRIFWVCDKAYDTPGMRILLNDPETVLHGPAARILKSDKTSTVVVVTISGRQLVVKRSNIKSFWHALKRAFRKTRAAVSWRNAQQLIQAEISTPKPVAIIEKRFGFLRGTGYFINEYTPGTLLADYFSGKMPDEALMLIGDKMREVLEKLTTVQARHGDFQAGNIMMKGMQPVLLDLDAMRFYKQAWRWRSKAKKDRKRFLRDWNHKPEIYEYFSRIFK